MKMEKTRRFTSLLECFDKYDHDPLVTISGFLNWAGAESHDTTEILGRIAQQQGCSLSDAASLLNHPSYGCVFSWQVQEDIINLIDYLRPNLVREYIAWCNRDDSKPYMYEDPAEPESTAARRIRWIREALEDTSTNRLRTLEDACRRALAALDSLDTKALNDYLGEMEHAIAAVDKNLLSASNRLSELKIALANDSNEKNQ